MKHSSKLFLVVAAYTASVLGLMAQNIPAPDDVAKAPNDAIVSETGLASKVLQAGTGTEKPDAFATVKVHYTGWQSSDGVMFDSSVSRGEPIEFPLSGVIPGWTEGVQLMVVGEKRRFWIPADLAYGEQPSRPGGPSGQLVFDVELLSFEKGPEPMAIPEGAVKKESGVSVLIVEAGEGDKIKEGQLAEFNFDIKDPEGNVIHSSKQSGQALKGPLADFPPFFTEAVKELKPGGKADVYAKGSDVRVSFPIVKVEVEVVSFEDPPAPMTVPENAVKGESGVSYVVTTEGEGTSPTADQFAKFHFTFTDPSGEVVQSSKAQGEPVKVAVKELPPFFTEPFKVLKPGGVAVVYVPGDLLGAPHPIVKLDLELLEVTDPIPAPAVPEDVAAVPADAKKTTSGLAYKVIKDGEGGDKPTAASTVTVHYSGWETNGEMFDSSVVRGETTSFPLGGVIPGWTEGLQLMSKGDKFRFWIPENLAYGPKQEGGGPGGLLVFDVELVEFK